jgi:hypothetical protein
VDFELNVLDLLDVGVEFEGWQDEHSLELSSLSFFVLVVSALHEIIILSMRIELLFILFLLLEKTDLLSFLQLLFQLFPDLCLFFLVLLHADSQDLFNILVLPSRLEVEDVSFAQLAEVVVVEIGKGVFLAPAEHQSLLDHQLVPHQLVFLEFQHPLLDCLLSHQPIHRHWACLPDAVGAVHSLQVVLRVPIDIVQDHPICCYQIEA